VNKNLKTGNRFDLLKTISMTIAKTKEYNCRDMMNSESISFLVSNW
jgi:hypothetical protein